jgi:hypothetical protein
VSKTATSLRRFSIFNLQSSIFNLQSSIFNLQSSNFQPATCNPQPATRNPQPATRNLQPATKNFGYLKKQRFAWWRVLGIRRWEMTCRATMIPFV